MKYLTAFFLQAALITGAFAQNEVRIITDTVPAKNNQQKVITVRLKGDKADEKKYTIEIDGDKIKVNGKDVADLKDIDVSIGKNRSFSRNGSHITINGQPLEGFGEFKRAEGFPMDLNNGDRIAGLRGVQGFNMNDNKAYLGIGMEKTDDGVRITDVMEKSGAEKAGLKEGDVVVKLDGKDVKTEMDITRTIGSHKPGDELTVTYKRDGRQQSTKAVLGKSEGMARSFYYNGDGQGNMGEAFAPFNNQDFDFKIASPPGDFKMIYGDGDFPGIAGLMSNKPRLGVSVKETEAGKGMEVTDVDENSAASKAGLKTGDIINEVGGKTVNSVEEVRKAVNENKDKPFTVKYTRDGKSMSTEVKFPKKLKETDL